jgi:hypothetical protein
MTKQKMCALEIKLKWTRANSHQKLTASRPNRAYIGKAIVTILVLVTEDKYQFPYLNPKEFIE